MLLSQSCLGVDDKVLVIGYVFGVVEVLEYDQVWKDFGSNDSFMVDDYFDSAPISIGMTRDDAVTTAVGTSFLHQVALRP